MDLKKIKLRNQTDKLKKELMELKKNRGSINDFCDNFVFNFYDNAAFMHSILKKSDEKKYHKTACKQYFVSLVSCLETFFRDTFIYIHTTDKNLMDSLCKRFGELNLPEESELTQIGIFSKSFNFQNLNNIKDAFNELWEDDFLETLCNTRISPCMCYGQMGCMCIKDLFSDWNQIIKETFEVRHKIIHDANYRLENGFELIEKAETLFLFLPQVAKIIISQRYQLPILVASKPTDKQYAPAILTIHEILSEDWEVVDDEESGGHNSQSLKTKQIF